MAVVYRELEIRFPNGDYHTIIGSNIMAESMIITKSICDGNLKLGGCIATQFELQLIDISPDMVQGKKYRQFYWNMVMKNLKCFIPVMTSYRLMI